MRIWDLEPEKLCRQHLLGEHRELHALWVILSQGKKGYSKHPETLRWQGRLRALYNRHEALVEEMTARNYNHHSPLDERMASGEDIQTEYVDTVEQQIQLLREKECDCRV